MSHPIFDNPDYKHAISILREKGKKYFRALAPAGWVWGGIDDNGTALYQKGNHSDGFQVMNCSMEDMENGNIEYFAKHGLSRIN